jgi:hypothetical protein
MKVRILIRCLILMLVFGASDVGAKAKTKAPEPDRARTHPHLERFHEEGGITIYIDLRNRQPLADGIMAWKVWNYRVPKDLEGYVFRSERVQTQYDCKNHKVRLIMWVAHSEPMGSGEIVAAGIDPKGWEDIAPRSLNEMEWDHFCR